MPWVVQTSPAVGIPRRGLSACAGAAEEGWTFLLKGTLGLGSVLHGISMHTEERRSRRGLCGQRGGVRNKKAFIFFREKWIGQPGGMQGTGGRGRKGIRKRQGL